MYLNSNKILITDIVKPGMYVNGSYTRLGINQKPGSKYEVRDVQKVDLVRRIQGSGSSSFSLG